VPRKKKQAVAVFSEGGRRRQQVHNVDTFAVGNHRGKEYTPADMTDIAENFRAFSTGPKPDFRVPAVVGHEEPGEGGLMEQSDIPAAAWIDAVKTDGSKLRTDWDDLHPKVADLIRGRRYNTVSAEIYDAPPEGVPPAKVLSEIERRRGLAPHAAIAKATAEAPAAKKSWQAEPDNAGKTPPPDTYFVDERLRAMLGKALRRVSALGGELPQVKSLDEIPNPVEVHAERGGKYRATVMKFREIRPSKLHGVYQVFSEVVPMSREELIKALTAEGYNPELLATMNDAQLAECHRVCEEGDESELEPDDIEHMSEEEKKAKFDEYAGMAAKYACTKASEVPAATDGLVKPAVHAEPPPAHVPPVPPAPAAHVPPAPAAHVPVAQPVSPQPKVVTVSHKFSDTERASLVTDITTAVVAQVVPELEKRFDPLKKDIVAAKGDVDKFKEETAKSRKREKIVAVFAECKDRISAAELDKTSPLPTLEDDLMLLDDTAVIHKFREGKATREMTALDIQLAKIKARKPASKFNEKIGAGAADSPAVVDEKAELEKVDAFYEQNKPVLSRFGFQTVEKYRESFKSAKKLGVVESADEFVAGYAK